MDEIISKVQSVSGVDVIYFLDKDYNIVKEKKLAETQNYKDEVVNILKSESKFNSIGSTFLSNSFHTYTLLNEQGLIIITQVDYLNLSLIIIAGENEPVDLISLLRICKEIRLDKKHEPVAG